MEFHFTVPGMTKEQAAFLMDFIVHLCELLGLQVGGGYNDGSQES